MAGRIGGARLPFGLQDYLEDPDFTLEAAISDRRSPRATAPPSTLMACWERFKASGLIMQAPVRLRRTALSPPEID
jgi:hypothetical protein